MSHLTIASNRGTVTLKLNGKRMECTYSWYRKECQTTIMGRQPAVPNSINVSTAGGLPKPEPKESPDILLVLNSTVPLMVEGVVCWVRDRCEGRNLATLQFVPIKRTEMIK